MTGRSTISKIRTRYLRARCIEVILFGFAAAFLAASLAWLFNLSTYAITAVSLVFGAAVAAQRVYALSLSKVDNLRIAFYLNRFYPHLKESSDLLVKDGTELSSLEEIQLQRIDRTLTELLPSIQLPNRITLALITLLISVLLFTTSLILRPALSLGNAESVGSQNQSQQAETSTPPVVDPRIKSTVITITPPTYTGLAVTKSNQLSFQAPEGSIVSWTLEFHHPVESAKIVMTTGDSIVVNPSNEKVVFQTVVQSTAIYRVQWKINSTWHASDYFRIDVRPDQIPHVVVNDLPQFTKLKWGEKPSIAVTSTMKDDYGLSSGHVIATVSKGSGESVKFREEQIPFTSPVSGKQSVGRLTLDFQKLGMEPGDEVYFYVEAFDNKQPTPQRNRTDTYFIALQDTAQQEIVMDEGLGVDLMPDYFRSQRQLIIDTEKLLSEQKKISTKQFNSTSNELGYDQKVLRLRYGQFLGEEFETSIGESAVNEQEEENEKDEDIMKKYGHQHDTENEHNLVSDKKTPESGHQHNDEKDKDDPMAAYRHDHDSEEEATFFTQSIKAKLRAALTLMWDSELQLRMFKPKESLPYQYQILKLLKEISQDSRVYVHRMGFDPPPLKEERRLTGSLEEVNPIRTVEDRSTTEQYPAIRRALAIVATLLQEDQITISSEQRAQLQLAGDELAGVALKTPGNYLSQLSQIRSIIESEGDLTKDRSSLRSIQQAFWSVLPREASTPTRLGSSGHKLDSRLMDELKSKAND